MSKKADGLQKHVMRYPQIFATKAIERKLDEGDKKGIIWHTQGSGKTALAYYNVHYLTDYFQTKGRRFQSSTSSLTGLDLLTQANASSPAAACRASRSNSREPCQRHQVDRRSSTMTRASPKSQWSTSRNLKMIQMWSKQSDYDVNIQRVYFLDEVHRSYNPEGSFLANLSQSDRTPSRSA